MAIDYDNLKNWHFPEVRQTYTDKDTMLYGLGIGFGHDPLDAKHLQYVYEDGLRAFPTMSVVLGFPGFWISDPKTGVNWVKLVHGEQRLKIHQPLKPSGTVIGQTRVTHIVDKGAEKGAIVVSERTLKDEDGTLLATLTQSTFCRADGGFGKGDEPPAPLSPTPDTPADKTLSVPISERAALIYRLCADNNPLHADPAVARAAGFPRPILHGLCTYAVAARAIVEGYCDGDGSRLTGLDVRFSSPVYPGETLTVDMWRDGPGKIRFLARIVERDKVVLSHGTATYN